MYKLYGSPANRAARIIWMLEELGEPYEVIDAKPRSEEVRALNPAGKIPILVDGDQNIFNSTAILMHLADKHGKLTFPLNSPERTRMNGLICFAIDDLEQPLWTMVKHGFIYPKEIRAADAVKPACTHDFLRALKTLEAFLGDGPFLMGEAFTIPDIIVGHLGGWAKATGFPAPEGAVADYMERVRARPGWQAVVKSRKTTA